MKLDEYSFPLGNFIALTMMTAIFHFHTLYLLRGGERGRHVQRSLLQTKMTKS